MYAKITATWAFVLITCPGNLIISAQEELPPYLFYNDKLIRFLDLNPAQETIRSHLHAAYAEQVPDVVRNAPKGETEKALMKLRKQLSAEFKSVLTPEQIEIAKGYYRWANLGGKQSVSSFKKQTTRDLLGLSAKQKEKIEAIASVKKQKQEKAEKQVKQELEELAKAAQRELEELLLDFQNKQYQQHLGEIFDFQKAGLGRVLAQAASFYFEDSVPTSISMIDPTFSPLVFVFMSKTVDIEMDFGPAIQLLINELVADDIDLSVAQQKKIKSMYEPILDRFGDLQEIKVKVKTNLSEEELEADENARRILEEAKANQKKLQSLEDFLSERQLKRLTQIYHQFVAKAGSREGVILFHRGWKKFLEMTDEQVKSFDQIKTRYFENKKTIRDEFAKQVLALQIESYKSCLELLDERQLEVWRRASGVFGEIADNAP